MVDVLKPSQFIGTTVGSFMKEYQLEDSSMCEDLIQWAENKNAWEESKITNFASSLGAVDSEVRSSKEISLGLMSENELNESPVLRFATDCINEYINTWPESNLGLPFLWMREPPLILKYEKGESYSQVHCDMSPIANFDRHLTFSLYLNTVDEGGELSFKNFANKISPVAGKGIVFPSGWTHAHSTTPTLETKYVLQLWWSYMAPEPEPEV
jgi:hypothetical protein